MPRLRDSSAGCWNGRKRSSRYLQHKSVVGGISTFVREKEFTSFLRSNDDAAFACEWNRFEWCYSFNLCDFLASVIQLLLKCDVSVK